MVRDLSGKGMNAEFNGDRDFVTASTFKMFLAYAVLHKVETGELTMDSQTDMGLSARACIEEMILHSTNACALSLFNLAGWDYVHNFIKGQFPSTSLKNSANADNEKHSTVRDETNYFIKLNAGQLMNGDNTNYLLGLFKRQVYRSGIPKGVPGVVVANKVGFYDGYKHDVGLVYANRGTYVLGFLSFGGNDGQIADLSGQVYSLLNR
jgi:beta-lactamase class A